MVPGTEVELAITCGCASSLQRYLPTLVTVDNFWQLRGKRDFLLVSFPQELCRLSPQDKKASPNSPSLPEDNSQSLQLSFELGVRLSSGAIRPVDPQDLPSIFLISGYPWLSLSKGQPIQLLLSFLRLPSDFEGSPSEFELKVRLHNRSGVDISGRIAMKCPPPTPSPTRSLKRSKDNIATRTSKRLRSSRDEIPVSTEWMTFFSNAGISRPSDLAAYAAIMSDQKVSDWEQLSRIPIEMLQQLGFKITDIAKVRDYIAKIGSPRKGVSESSDDEDADDSSDAIALRSSSSSDSASVDFSDAEFSDEEEIAVQLLMLFDSNSSHTPSPAPLEVSPPPVSRVVVPVPTGKLPEPLSMNQVVHLTIKLGKLIICEVKDKDPSNDLRERLILAEQVESLLNRWVEMMFPNQKPLTLEDVREMTEQPSPPFDLSLAYYVKVFSLHLQLKENSRIVLKREHLLLPMEDVAKLLGLSLTKISREYQKGCVLTCGWILKGRKRSLRWPSRPLHVLLGHISEKILRETPTQVEVVNDDCRLPSSIGVTTRAAAAASSPSKSQLAVLASTAAEDTHPSAVARPIINCY